MPRTRGLAAGLALSLAASSLAAQQVDWQYPAVRYGPVVPIEGASAERAGGEAYKVVFNITQARWATAASTTSSRWSAASSISWR